MSVKKIQQIKDNKPFKIWDVAAYAAILIVVAVLFVILYFTRERGELTGISVLYDGAEVFTYDFTEDEYELLDAAHIIIVEDTGEALSLRFVMDAQSPDEDYNDIYIDKSAVSVSVTEADCSSHKDCCYMSAITDDSMEIYCTPHKLRVTAANFKPSGTDIIM